jgi:uncharacterized membrane protein YhaH (DUF805 family)
MSKMFEPFRRYADFSGRTPRTEFWLFIIFQWLVYFGLFILTFGFGASLIDFENGGRPSDFRLATASVGMMIMMGIMLIFWLATLVPNLAVAARRMQDQDIPGGVGIGLVILGWIFWPFGFLIMAVFGFIPGTRGHNRYGPDPKGDHAADVFS